MDDEAVEAQTWFVQRLPEGKAWPRSPELQPTGLRDAAGGLVTDNAAWEAAVATLVERRRRLLATRAAWPGRLLRFQPVETLSDGAADYVTAGFLDIDNTPPWDTWVAFEDGFLYAWIPQALEVIVQDAIDVNPERCLSWATAGWTLRRRADGRIEAVCTHSVGHGLGVHGCDLCCQAPDFPREHLQAVGDFGHLGR